MMQHGHEVQDWPVRQCLILDWYDGPVEGLLELGTEPVQEYWFRFIFREYDRDFILFSIVSVEAGTLAASVAAAGPNCYRKGNIWNPFTADVNENHVDLVMDAVRRGRAAQSDRAYLLLGRQIAAPPLGLVDYPVAGANLLASSPELSPEQARDLVLATMTIDIDDIQCESAEVDESQ